MHVSITEMEYGVASLNKYIAKYIGGGGKLHR